MLLFILQSITNIILSSNACDIIISSLSLRYLKLSVIHTWSFSSSFFVFGGGWGGGVTVFNSFMFLCGSLGNVHF